MGNAHLLLIIFLLFSWVDADNNNKGNNNNQKWPTLVETTHEFCWGANCGDVE